MPSVDPRRLAIAAMLVLGLPSAAALVRLALEGYVQGRGSYAAAFVAILIAARAGGVAVGAAATAVSIGLALFGAVVATGGTPTAIATAIIGDGIIGTAATIVALSLRASTRERRESRTEADRASLRLESAARREAALRDLATELGPLHSARQIGDVLARAFATLLPARAIAVLVVRDPGRAIGRAPTHRGEGDTVTLATLGDVAALDATRDLVTQALATGAAVRDPRPAPGWTGLASDEPDALHVRRLAVPVLAGPGAWGAVAVVLERPVDLDDAATDGLVTMGRLAGEALSRAADLDAARVAGERAGAASLRVTRLQSLAGELSRHLGPAAIARAVADAAAAGVGASVTVLHAVESDGVALQLVGARGYPTGLAAAEARMTLGVGLPAAQAAKTGRRVDVDAREWSTRFPGASDVPAMAGIDQLTAIPAGGPRPTAVLVVGRTAPRPFSPEEVAYLEAVADLAAQALSRTELLESEREARRLQEAFVGVISHELRTPITTILAGAKLILRNASLPPSARELVEDVDDEAERLHRLVEDLLILSRLERGNLTPGREPVHLGHLVERVLASEAPRWPGRTFTVTRSTSGEVVEGEDTYVEQILRNLLSNAAKYSPPGSHVEVVLEPAADEIVARVLDEGPGIASDEVGDLFTLFYRSPATAAAASGAGIGLFVCDRLVRAMGGRIWARRRPDHGSEFGFALRRYVDPDASEDDLDDLEVLGDRPLAVVTSEDVAEPPPDARRPVGDAASPVVERAGRPS